MKMEQTQCAETSVIKHHTPENSHPTFIWNISPFVLKVSRSMKYDLKSFQTNVTVFFETSESDYPVMQHHILEAGKFPTTPLRKPQNVSKYLLPTSLTVAYVVTKPVKIFSVLCNINIHCCIKKYS
jgi:hypothetical protein